MGQKDNTHLLQDDTDFFSLGLRSFDVMELVNKLQKLDFFWADYAIINKNPTLTSLASRLTRGRDDSDAPPPIPVTDSINHLITSYSDFVNSNVQARDLPSGHHVVSGKRSY